MSKLDEIVGLDAWKAEIGVGSHLTIELGEKWVTRRGKSRGQWSIWIAGLPWRVFKKGSLLVGSGQDVLKTKDVQFLNHTTLLNYNIPTPAYDATFEFSGGFHLQVFVDAPENGGDLSIMSKRGVFLLDGSGRIREVDN